MEKPGSPPLLRTCPACNSRIQPDHEFCEICGAKMPELPACSNCGARFIAPVKFCELCGTPVRPQEVPAAVQSKKTEPVHEPETPLAAQAAIRKENATPPPPAPELPPLVPPAVTKEIAARVPPAAEQPGITDDVLFFIPGDTVPAKPPANRTRVIGGIVLLVIILAVIAFIALPILAGHGGPGGTSKPAAAAVTPSPEPTFLITPPTPTPIPVPTTASGPLIPQPTQSLPGGQKVYFQVQKDAVSGKISVRYEGSTVANSVISADITVTQPGGAIATGIILPPKGVTELILSGSRGVADRVEILAKMTNGQTYRVVDMLVS